MKKPIYVVEHFGNDEFDSTDLTRVLRFIGFQMTGRTFGALNVTMAAAMAAGYSIRQC